MKLKITIAMIGFFISIVCGDTTTTYNWPIPNGIKQVSSNFCDYRPLSSSPPHFHEGIDIPVVGSADVRCVTSNFQLRGLPELHPYGWVVKVQHYTDDTSAALLHGSKYIHMNDVNDTLNDTLEIYSGVYISHQTSFQDNHLHFNFHKPDPLSGSMRINPFFRDEFRPLDNYYPVLLNLYVDYSCHGNANVENLNFLGYNFSSYYRDTTYGGITFTKLKLPAETPDNDLDDPHIMISGNRKARFVIEGYDNFFSSTDRGAPYELSLFLLDADTLGEIQKSYYTLRFDSLLGSPDEVHQEEDVYHVSAPLISGIGAPQYYRLYPCDSVIPGLPGCVITGATELRTEDLEEGMHRIRIYAQDYRANTKTADVHFYIRKSTWVDFCRGFKE